jgi:polar amino acid transport system substrate-binding protein
VAIDLNEVVRKAASLVGNQIKKATDDFGIDFAPEPSMALGSFQRLEQVIINLLLNACQALPDRQCPIRVKIGREGEWAVVRVSDGGVGIRPELLAQITDPFFTTRREQGGTGLGLSVSSRIVEEHGGTIHFESNPGTGTCVTVTLPAG